MEEVALKWQQAAGQASQAGPEASEGAAPDAGAATLEDAERLGSAEGEGEGLHLERIRDSGAWAREAVAAERRLQEEAEGGHRAALQENEGLRAALHKERRLREEKKRKLQAVEEERAQLRTDICELQAALDEERRLGAKAGSVPDPADQGVPGAWGSEAGWEEEKARLQADNHALKAALEIEQRKRHEAESQLKAAELHLEHQGLLATEAQDSVIQEASRRQRALEEEVHRIRFLLLEEQRLHREAQAELEHRPAGGATPQLEPCTEGLAGREKLAPDMEGEPEPLPEAEERRQRAILKGRALDPGELLEALEAGRRAREELALRHEEVEKHRTWLLVERKEMQEAKVTAACLHERELEEERREVREARATVARLREEAAAQHQRELEAHEEGLEEASAIVASVSQRHQETGDPYRCPPPIRAHISTKSQ